MEEIYDHYINLYILNEDNIRIHIGDFNSEGVLPNKGDIIEIDSENYEVLKRRINYNQTPPSISLYVSEFE